MRAAVIANSEFKSERKIVDLIKSSDLLVCANGGARVARELGIMPSAIVGDLDSISKEIISTFKKKGTEIIEHLTEKDYTDLELAVNYAEEKGANEILIFGALGGRPDHFMANIILLSDLLKRNIRAKILSGQIEIFCLNRYGEIKGKAGDAVSLLPLSNEVHFETITGLKFIPPANTLQFGAARGISNVMLEDTAILKIRSGIVLVFHFNK
ncbi:MAG: thiamine diphosphokinase [Actinobacteria bacterium]|nr:thiamine diphosphokinase [Actinomycetota bacterium]